MNNAKRREIFARLQAENPAPKTELNYQSTFELLVAVMLSAQATDVSVNLATARLFPLANSPRAILDLGLDKVRNCIKTIGLFNAKAKNLLATCQILIDEHDGEVPANREALERLPGVGRKTANVVLNTAFRQPVIAVDTHIFRVANRTRLATGKTVNEVEDRLTRWTPREFRLDAHHWLILHGRYTCKARRPECWRCTIEDLCEYRNKSPDPASTLARSAQPKACSPPRRSYRTRKAAAKPA
ncbi:MAG: endonuclease III [Thioalkalivibrionaceae bacterium]